MSNLYIIYLRQKLLNTRITEFKPHTKAHCQIDIVLLTGRVQMMLHKTEEVPPCKLRHCEVRQDYWEFGQFCVCYQLKKTSFRFHLTLIRL